MTNFSSQQYWEDRYKKGGNSGAGSYGRLAQYKADFINDFVASNNIESVIELGVGDGNQLSLFDKFDFCGLDVSTTILQQTIARFSEDESKSFMLYDAENFVNNGFLKADTALSLDVIFHLVEDKIYQKYMDDLFGLAKRFVVIYSSNIINPETAQHVRHRIFTDYIKENQKNWVLKDKEKNSYTLKDDSKNESFADFYIYEKK